MCQTIVNTYPLNKPTKEELEINEIYVKNKKHYCSICEAKIRWVKAIKKEDKMCKCGHRESRHDNGSCWGVPYGRSYLCSCKEFREDKKEEVRG